MFQLLVGYVTHVAFTRCSRLVTLVAFCRLRRFVVVGCAAVGYAYPLPRAFPACLCPFARFALPGLRLPCLTPVPGPSPFLCSADPGWPVPVDYQFPLITTLPYRPVPVLPSSVLPHRAVIAGCPVPSSAQFYPGYVRLQLPYPLRSLRLIAAHVRCVRPCRAVLPQFPLRSALVAFYLTCTPVPAQFVLTPVPIAPVATLPPQLRFDCPVHPGWLPRSPARCPRSLLPRLLRYIAVARSVALLLALRFPHVTRCTPVARWLPR